MPTRKTKIIESVVYVTSDNKEFRYESDAEYHEEKLFYEKVEKTLTSMEIPSNIFEDMVEGNLWYLLKNTATIQYFKDKYLHNGNTLNDHSRYGELALGEWVGVRYTLDSDGDKSYIGLYTLSYVMADMRKFLARVEPDTVEGKY